MRHHQVQAARRAGEDRGEAEMEEEAEAEGEEEATAKVQNTMFLALCKCSVVMWGAHRWLSLQYKFGPPLVACMFHARCGRYVIF